MDLYGNRHEETYIFKRVSWQNFQELEEYPWITTGSIEYAADTDLKTTGSFDFEGVELPNTSDLMRVYYRYTDDSGEVGTYPIGTYFVGYSNLQHVDTLQGLKSKGTLEASSMLKALEDPKTGTPYIIQRGKNYIYEAQKIITSFGLQVDYIPDSNVLTIDHVFDAGTSYLEIVNWLCEQAGYAEAYPDAYGTIVVKPVSEIQRTLETITLQNDDKSILYPEIEKQNDYQNTPNVVRLLYDAENSCIIATAKNMSGSRSSLSERGGREQTDFEDIGDLPAGGSLLNSLMALAKDRLIKLSTDIEYVEYEHAYIPMQLYQGMTLIFSELTWTGNIDNYSIELTPGTKVQTKLKREQPQDITIELTGSIIRGQGE